MLGCEILVTEYFFLISMYCLGNIEAKYKGEKGARMKRNKRKWMKTTRSGRKNMFQKQDRTWVKYGGNGVKS